MVLIIALQFRGTERTYGSVANKNPIEYYYTKNIFWIWAQCKPIYHFKPWSASSCTPLYYLHVPPY